MRNRNQNAVQAFYFVNRFHDHLATLGFRRSSKSPTACWSRPARAPNGGAGNNAFMYTPPDGKSPTMHLQLWNRDGRNTNAGDDASIVYHEYTHGLSGRLITDAAGAGALNSPQAGAMGEGWSDCYAKDFLNPADTAASGEIHMGEYAGRASASRRSTAPSARRPRRARRRAARRRAPAASPTATTGRSGSTSPRSTPTARSGRRRCGTSGARSARPRRGA